MSHIQQILDAFERDGVTLSAEVTQRIILESNSGEIPQPERVISAPQLIGLEATARLLNVDFGHWDSPMALSENGISEAAESVLNKMRDSVLTGCGFPSRFTLINILICDIFNAYKPILERKKIRIKGDCPILTQLPNSKSTIIKGSADMVISYRLARFVQIRFKERATAVILETKTKNRPDTNAVLAQTVAYMVGIHQKRVFLDPNSGSAAEAITYGIVSDGIEWQFMKLQGRIIERSRVFSMEKEEDRDLVYRFVHDVVKGSIEQAPTNGNH